jgi:hypothetical protein
LHDGGKRELALGTVHVHHERGRGSVLVVDLHMLVLHLDPGRVGGLGVDVHNFKSVSSLLLVRVGEHDGAVHGDLKEVKPVLVRCGTSVLARTRSPRSSVGAHLESDG